MPMGCAIQLCGHSARGRTLNLCSTEPSYTRKGVWAAAASRRVRASLLRTTTWNSRELLDICRGMALPAVYDPSSSGYASGYVSSSRPLAMSCAHMSSERADAESTSSALASAINQSPGKGESEDCVSL